MKNFVLINIWVVCLAFALVGCQENDRMMYTDKPAVYFSSVTEKDSIFYSFASGLKNEDLVSIPVRIMGVAMNHDRHITIEVDGESTAVDGVHYKGLSKSIVLKAGQVDSSIDITVMNNQLKDGDVKLVLNLVTNDEFALGYGGALKAKLVITNQLIKPSYWNMPLSLYYGAYSKAKHRLCIQLQGFDFPEKLDYNDISKYMSYGRAVYNYLLKTPIWDEETQTEITADWSPL